MAEVSMPRLSDTMEEGTISSWLKKPGEQIKKGEVIAQIETDKATMDLTAFEAGTLEEILAPEGTTVPIGQPVARIGNGTAPPRTASPATASPAPRSSGPASPPPTSPAPAAPAPAAPESASAGTASSASSGTASSAPSSLAHAAAEAGAAVDGQRGTDGKVRASPLARHLASEHGLDLAKLSGSGPQGRVIRADVEAALGSNQTAPVEPESGPADSVSAPVESAPQSSAPADDEQVPLSQMRRTIARRMAESTSTVPHFFLTTTIDASEMVKLRKQILEQTADAGVKITFNDLVVKGAALALRKMPDVNVSFAGDSLIRHRRIHIGIAVATDRGLIVPVLRDVDQKSLGEINRQTADLAERARSGKLQPPEYSGGTFTISNLGMFGVDQFNAVINPPEAAILAVGAIAREPAEHDGQIVLRDRMKLTLSVDHRALDGALGARYLQALKQLLEKPMLLLV